MKAKHKPIDAETVLDQLIAVFWDPATDDWRELQSCADAVQDCSIILEPVIQGRLSAAQQLTCASMTGHRCTRAVSMIDQKGYVYCGPCGLTRRRGGVPCRLLTPAELAQLTRGEAVRRY